MGQPFDRKLLPQLSQKSRLLDLKSRLLDLIDIAIVIKCLGRRISYRSTVDDTELAHESRQGTDRFRGICGIATELAKRFQGKFVEAEFSDRAVPLSLGG